MHPALRKGPLFYKKTPPPNLHLFYKKTLAPAILFPAHWPASTRPVVRYLYLNRCVPSIGVNATGDAGDTSPAIFGQPETKCLISPAKFVKFLLQSDAKRHGS